MEVSKLDKSWNGPREGKGNYSRTTTFRPVPPSGLESIQALVAFSSIDTSYLEMMCSTLKSQ